MLSSYPIRVLQRRTADVKSYTWKRFESDREWSSASFRFELCDATSQAALCAQVVSQPSSIRNRERYSGDETRGSLAAFRSRGLSRIQARVNRDEMTMREALEILGTKAASDVQEMIVEVSAPPNTAETIRGKGSSNPLIDTGHLRQQITHQVIDE